MKFEKRLSKEDREIFNSLKAFARFMEPAEFEELFENLVLERMIKTRIEQLKYFKESGLKTYNDIAKMYVNKGKQNGASKLEENSIRVRLAKNKIKSENVPSGGALEKLKHFILNESQGVDLNAHDDSEELEKLIDREEDSFSAYDYHVKE